MTPPTARSRFDPRDTPAGWNSGIVRPAQAPAPFQRLTALGVRVHVWDGIRWWSTYTMIGFGGRRLLAQIVSANQALPWREPERQKFAPGRIDYTLEEIGQ